MEQEDARLLGIVHECAKILESKWDDGKIPDRVLQTLATSLGLSRCAISAVDPLNGRIRIIAAFGLDQEQIRAGEYLPGEGVTGHVIARGEPIYIDDVSREPLFLNRTGSRDLALEHIAFSCVPIIHYGEVIGSLWMDLASDAGLKPNAWLMLLRVAAALLAPYIGRSWQATQDLGGKGLKFGRFAGNSRAMQQVYAQIMQVAPSRLTVFLGGESGTGKELAARAIHEGSPAASGPFISVNCAAIPETLVESELFGHEKGAFTGASQTRKGKFELAHGGTLFLDEIGETSLAVQARLLRVLQDHTFERIGGGTTIRTDARIITATNRNLSKMVEVGSFRLDLYYRLNVFPIVMPALRDRPEDIPALVDHFLQGEAAGNAPLEASPDTMAILQEYNWPGNIRELENVLERSALLARPGHIILPEHLPGELVPENAHPKGAGTLNLKAELEEYEKTAIRKALKDSRGHIGHAAKSLGMTERVLALRLNRYGIVYKDFRAAHK